MKMTRKMGKSVEVGSQVLEGEDERECRPDGGWEGALPRCSEFFSIMGMVTMMMVTRPCIFVLSSLSSTMLMVTMIQEQTSPQCSIVPQQRR